MIEGTTQPPRIPRKAQYSCRDGVLAARRAHDVPMQQRLDVSVAVAMFPQHLDRVFAQSRRVRAFGT